MEHGWLLYALKEGQHYYEHNCFWNACSTIGGFLLLDVGFFLLNFAIAERKYIRRFSVLSSLLPKQRGAKRQTKTNLVTTKSQTNSVKQIAFEVVIEDKLYY